MDAKIVREPGKEELDYMVGAAFPEWKSYRVSMLKGGLFNTTYLLEGDGGKYILRVGPVHRELLMPYENYLMDAEAWAYRKMAEQGIPTSVVIYLDTSKEHINRDFMIVEYIPSRGLNTHNYLDEDKNRIYREVGRYCRKMTDITGDKFGRVAFLLHGVSYDTWGAYIKSELENWAESIRRNTEGYYTEEELQRIISVADVYRDVLDEVKTPCFNHCDLWSLNVLVPQDGSAKVLAIIDPDRCCMGDPDFELASGWMMNDAFYEGYGRRINEADPHTRLRVTIYRMMFHILNGYFMRTEYDDKEPSLGDKEWGDKYLVQLLGEKS